MCDQDIQRALQVITMMGWFIATPELVPRTYGCTFEQSLCILNHIQPFYYAGYPRIYDSNSKDALKFIFCLNITPKITLPVQLYKEASTPRAWNLS